ncbi:lipase family protein [Corynebacterium lowii]|uniref:Putative inactive lipase n=1 Tax=Corynebacterium lowii TaxID=1544413 RepID=A0A0Q0YYD3_9CORY|nr:lipase family protein [Corynebacterium lowii]KQB87396.1 putative inactive lipase [Corynebacterium lowii]MDP9852014.1 hypothetical protein [Corynebacterium lowii]
MKKTSLVAVLTACALLTSLTPAVASVNGPHPGAPFGGSSVRGGDRTFFENHEDLSQRQPGEVLATRNIAYSAFGLQTPLNVTQIRYVTTDAQGNKVHGITSVVNPIAPSNGKLVSVHSVYDSLDPEHSPSRSIAGDVSFGNLAASGETAMIISFLNRGYSVAIPDIEGQDAHFIAGPEYGTTTLDGIRAALHAPETGLNQDSQVGLLGYSGGSIATNWAAQLAPTYAPEINDNLVGAATGGVLVNPENNINYVSGSVLWAPIQLMAIAGLARSYDLDLDPYLSDFGRFMVNRVEKAAITEVHGTAPGLTWESLMKPEYANPRSIPGLGEVLDKVNMHLGPNPTVPFYYATGTAGDIVGTPGNKPGIGPGDGVMIAGDSKVLADKYCEGGAAVQYEELPLDHMGTAVPWYVKSAGWLFDRFDGKAAPSTCGA